MITIVMPFIKIYTYIPYPINNYLSSHKLCSYSSFISDISSTIEPPSYKQAVKDPKWQKAIVAESKALESNQT